MKNKKLSIGIMSIITVMATSFGAFAAETQAESVSTALGLVASDILATIAAIAPVALTIAGAFLVWKYGMKFFKSVSK